MFFHWSLSDSKSPQVSRTLLSILADLNNGLHSPSYFQSSNLFINPLVTVPSAPITIGITVTFIFHSIFSNSSARSRFLSLFLIITKLFLAVFSTPALADCFYWGLRDIVIIIIINIIILIV